MPKDQLASSCRGGFDDCIQGYFVNKSLPAVLAFCVVMLTACGTPPQTPVALTTKAFAAPSNRIGVVMLPLPVVDTQFPGAGCLLCMAAASVANSELTTYTKTLPYEELTQLNSQVAATLKKKGAQVTMIEKIDLGALPDNGSKPNFARRDFTSLKAKHNIDKLLVIQLLTVGIERNYSSYIPAGDPKARCTASATSST